MYKASISNTLRNLGLLYPMDKLRYWLEKRKNQSINQKFKSENPDVVLPPDYLMYESFQMNYSKYYIGGKDTAKWVLDLLGKHSNLKGANILDWGCGPGRVIRHLPNLLQQNGSFFGTDYNEDSINWCKQHIQNVAFNHNGLEAQLPYEDDFFDAIYGISIFTHLSEEMHFQWIVELSRILKPGGVLMITTQGENFKSILSEAEQKTYDAGKLIVRGNVKEGHRTYSAFHPDAFLMTLFEGKMKVEEKIVISSEGKSYTPQDVWLLKKI